MTTGQAEAVEQCCALEGGARCLADTFQGWHLCYRHLTRGPRVPMVDESSFQSPIEQPGRS
jgi:hypothetical protein